MLEIAYITSAQNVYIPDANFKNFLINWGVDTSEDGEISYAEAAAKVDLYVHGELTDLTGIEAFINLDSLVIVGTLATSLDVSACTALRHLHCILNRLESLDVSGCTALEQISLSNMPDLYKVCVWKTPLPLGVHVYTDGSPNIYFTTDCADNIPDDYKENSTIHIYPTPSDDVINIEIENINNAIIEIYNLSGKMILSKILNSKFERIDISGFSRGIYIVKVRQDNTVNVGKIVIR